MDMQIEKGKGRDGMNWEIWFDINILPLPSGSDGKESACNVGDLGLIPELGRSPLQGYPLLYSPWGCKESDTTEQLPLFISSLYHPTEGRTEALKPWWNESDHVQNQHGWSLTFQSMMTWYWFHFRSKIFSSLPWHHWWKRSRIWNGKFLHV